MNKTSEQLWKELENDIKKLHTQYIQEFAKEFYGTFNNAPIPERLNYESLDELIKSAYEQAANLLVEVWFVDRHDMYMRLRQGCETISTDTDDLSQYMFSSIYGVRLFEIDTHFPIDKNAPWYASTPGVWLVFRNGNVVEFK